MGAGGSVSDLPSKIDKEMFRRISGGQMNDALFDANSVGGIMTREKLIELSSMRDCFMSYDRGADCYGRDIATRVQKIDQALKARGLITWFSTDYSNANILPQVCDGVDKSRSVICFVTKDYIDKVSGNFTQELCNMEFNYTLRRKHPDHMIPVVLEEALLNPANWSGQIGLALGNSQLINFVNDDDFDAKCDALYQRVINISRSNAIKLTAEQLGQGSILSQTNKSKEEQQFFQWMGRSTNIEESRRLIYTTALVKSGVSTVFLLAKTMKEVPGYLASIGMNDYDADQIALAIRDLGLGYDPVRDFSSSLTIESVIFSLRKASAAADDASLAESALACVARVAASNRIMPSIMNDAGICEAILKLLSRNLSHPPAMEYGCLAVYNMAVNNPEIAVKFGELTACDHLPRSMRSHIAVANIARNGCMAVGVLSKVNLPNRVKFSGSGTCEVVIKCMLKHPENADVAKESSIAATNLCIGYLDNIGKLSQAGGCDAAVAALANHSGDGPTAAAILDFIRVLSTDATSRVKLCTTANICGPLVQSLRAQMTHPDVCENACQAVSLVTIGIAYNRDCLGNAGTCEEVVRILQMYYNTNPAVSEAACRAVFSLAAGSQNNTAKLREVKPLVNHIFNNAQFPESTRKEAKEALLRL